MHSWQIFTNTTIRITTFGFAALHGCSGQKQPELPNILWITSEDNSPFLGCYGDEFAVTPNLDKLASEGFRYTHAYANAPVCAPARNTIITGVYANSGGNQGMRSEYPHSPDIKFYPEYLRAKGYYCANNSKEDYNAQYPKQGIWDESSDTAHYKHRKPGQPFFQIFNLFVSHESSIHQSVPVEDLMHDPNKVKLPPYHPDTPELRHDWAQYYDKITVLDSLVGNILQELEENGLADNTIVFYYADHGGVLARSKRYVYESGTHVPFIIHIPKKYRHLFPARKPGSPVDRLISFVDLAPTLLSIAEIPVPGYMQGHAFLGKQKTADPQYAFMFRDRMDERFDMSRAVRDNKFRYIHNYMPYRIYGQHLDYLWRAPSIRSWEKAYNEGRCNEAQSVFWSKKPVEELYDTENDPWEIHNLVGDPAYNDVLERMRKANQDWVTEIFDTGIIPEGERVILTGNTPVYDYFRSGKVNVHALTKARELASYGQTENIEQLEGYLKNNDSGLRYWGATGLLILGDKAKGSIPLLEKALQDTSPDVVAVAGEALFNLGKKKEAREAMLNVLNSPSMMARCRVLNAIDCINDESPETKEQVISFIRRLKPEDRNNYDAHAAMWLIDKWGVNREANKISYEYVVK